MRIDLNGTRLWFDVDGPSLAPEGGEMPDRPTVVLLHGGPGSFDHSYFKPDFARLAAEAQVVYLDLRDHGRSAWGDPADWSFEIRADDVRAFCDILGIVRPVVLGHSLGGYVAMLYAARHPDHAGALVLQSTNGRFDLARITEGFRQAGGDDVAEIATRFYRGDRAVTAEEWARCWRVFGPWVPERGRGIVNSALSEPGLALMRRFSRPARQDQLPDPGLRRLAGSHHARGRIPRDRRSAACGSCAAGGGRGSRALPVEGQA